MTELQIKWLAEQQKKLSEYISNNWPMTDEVAVKAIEFVSEVVEVIKKKNPKFVPEIRSALFDVLEHYDGESLKEK